ncbi:MAG: S-layer homology domain-containing protein [Oscillospiraceae bacterium]|nr:S-layer homology domain-containing protein [Oscillospiraceae bacterium]
MRKLKKSFAVLLVLVMALTMVPFAGATGLTTVASFNDAADVSPQHLMALDVLAAVNVLRGEDGNIFPQRTITRAEAATIVARILLGPNSADQLPPGRTGFRDVDGVSGLAFASGAIAYLHERGIVIGVGDDLFDPQAPVTGAELATMFLRAVGFGVNGEYTGPRWQTNAVVDGMQWRVLSGNADFTAAATREEVFRYAFNALNTTRSAVGLRFVNWSADRQAYVPILLQGIDVTGDAENLQTIWSRIFEPAPINARRLSVADMWGRPSDRFTLRGIEIGTYAREAAVTFNRFTSTAAVNEEIRNFNTDAFIQRFVNGNGFTRGSGNGWEILSDGYVNFGHATLNGIPANANTGEQISRLTGNGVVVEVYVSASTNNITDVVVIRTDIAQVRRVDAGARETHFALITADEQDDIRSAVFGEANYGGASMRIGPLHSLFDDATDLRVDDRVLVTPVWRNGEWQVGQIAMPEVVSGTLTTSSHMVNFTNSAGALTVAGTSYTRARVLTEGARRATMTGPNQEVTVLLDEFGFIVDTETRGISTRNIVFVRDANQQTLQGGLLVPLLRGWYPDGTVASVALTGGVVGGTIEPGEIVRVSGSGNNVVATRQYFVGSTSATVVNNLNLATAPAVGTASVSSMTAPIAANTSIAPNQATLNVGGRVLRFADDAMYFFWGQRAGQPNFEFTVRDRNIRVQGPMSGLPGLTANNIVAVVEYRQSGQAPVITALWIGTTAQQSVSPSTTIFVRGTGNIFHHTVNIDGVTYRMAQAWDIDGNTFDWTWPGPEAIPTGWIPIRDNTNPEGAIENRFYNFTVDSDNRFELEATINDVYENLGVFSRVYATPNGLNNVVTFVDAGNEYSAVITNATTFIDQSGVTPAINDAISLRNRIDTAGPVMISIVFDRAGDALFVVINNPLQ